MDTKTGSKSPNSQQWVSEILTDLEKYESMFVVHTDSKVAFYSPQLAEAEGWANANQSYFQDGLRIFLVPKNFGQVRLRMLKIKSLSAGEWLPMFQVKFFKFDGGTATLEMLVDSGADVTFIPLKVGEHLGFETSFGETPLLASGVGSKVPYLLREAKMKIDGIDLYVRLLWGQDDSVGDILLGRLDVFDHFDVTFSQTRQKVFFEIAQTNT